MVPAPIADPPEPAATAGRCIVCDGGVWAPRFEILLECRACGFVRAAEDISPEAVREIYGRSYFFGDEYADYLGETRSHLKNFARRWQMMQQAGGRPQSVFEIGSAYGLWLRLVTEHGVRAAGVDVNEEAVSHAREVLEQEASSADFLDLEITPGEFQTFVMWDTIEHLVRPDLFVARIADLLPAGGWLYVTTGDVGSRNARRRGRNWRMIHPPTHLQYFSRDTLSRFLERYGFEVRQARSLPVFRSLGGTLANLEVLGQGIVRRLAGGMRALLPEALAGPLGLWVDLGDILFVAAQKSGPAPALEEPPR